MIYESKRTAAQTPFFPFPIEREGESSQWAREVNERLAKMKGEINKLLATQFDYHCSKTSNHISSNTYIPSLVPFDLFFPFRSLFKLSLHSEIVRWSRELRKGKKE